MQAEAQYPPRHYIEYDRQSLLAAVRAHPLATFVVANEALPYATPLPMVLLAESEPVAPSLLAHLDANNPVVQFMRDGLAGLAVFRGPSSYISPNDYTTRQLPTYNYVEVQALGKVQLLDRATTRADLLRLSAAMEAEPERRLRADDPRIDPLLDQVLGFRLTDLQLTGRFKLSQDKRLADREAAWTKLQASCPHLRLEAPPSVRLAERP